AVHGPLQVVDETLVDLDGVEPVVGQHVAGDGAGDRAGAGADLKDAGGGARLPQLVDERPRQEPAAGQDGAGGAELAAELAEEGGALLEEAHPDGLSLHGPVREPTRPRRLRRRRPGCAGPHVALRLRDPTAHHSTGFLPKVTQKPGALPTFHL